MRDRFLVAAVTAIVAYRLIEGGENSLYVFGVILGATVFVAWFSSLAPGRPTRMQGSGFGKLLDR